MDWLTGVTPHSFKDDPMSIFHLAEGLAIATFLAGLLSPNATADPVYFSTSGTIPSDEPDQALHGVSQASSAGLFSFKGLDGVYRDFMQLGEINVLPIDGFDGVGFPIFGSKPFDIHVDFSNGVPSLEVKGSFNGRFISDGFAEGWVGSIQSITSSAPNLNFELPAPFGEMIAHPENGYIAIGADDWDFTRLAVYAVYQPMPIAVPEPTTLLIFTASATGLGLARRRRSHRASTILRREA
jgi:hypothetical protein